MESPFCWVCHTCKQWFPKGHKGADLWFRKHLWCEQSKAHGTSAIRIQAYDEPPEGYCCSVSTLELLGEVGKEE
jgi:hypothetical protein